MFGYGEDALPDALLMRPCCSPAAPMRFESNIINNVDELAVRTGPTLAAP